MMLLGLNPHHATDVLRAHLVPLPAGRDEARQVEKHVVVRLHHPATHHAVGGHAVSAPKQGFGERECSNQNCHTTGSAHQSGSQASATSLKKVRVLLGSWLYDSCVVRCVASVWLVAHGEADSSPHGMHNNTSHTHLQWQSQDVPKVLLLALERGLLCRVCAGADDEAQDQAILHLKPARGVAENTRTHTECAQQPPTDTDASHHRHTTLTCAAAACPQGTRWLAALPGAACSCCAGQLVPSRC